MIMKMKKLFLIVLSVVPLGMFAQEIRYVTAPTSQRATPASADVYAPAYQPQQSQMSSQSYAYSDELLRDTLKTSNDKAARTTFIKNKSKDNWFISIFGGGSILESEESRYLKFGDLLRPSFGFALGKWHSPVWGLRFNASAGKLRGLALDYPSDYFVYDYVNDVFLPRTRHYFMGSWYNGKNYSNGFDQPGVQTSYTPGVTIEGSQLIFDRYLNNETVVYSAEGANAAKGYTYDLTYAATSLDLLLNLRNLFSRYNPKASLDPVFYAGVGFAHTLGDRDKDITAVNSIMGTAGLQLNFRLTDRCDLFVDGKFLVLPEFFDRRLGDGNTMDIVASGLIGLTFKLGEANFYQPLCGGREIVYMPSAVPTVINETRSECCDELIARLRSIENQLDKPVSQSITRVNENMKVIVYFVIDKWDVRPSEMYKLDEISKFMAKYPQVRVSISGYADVQTAYPAYNMKLSERRANEVARILSSKYGIDRSRLRVEHYGDTVQPFDTNELNRAVIAFDIP